MNLDHNITLSALAKLATAAKLQRLVSTRLRRRRASTIARFEEVPSLTRLCESMNRPAASSKAHVAMARRQGRSCASLNQDPSHPTVV
jgi:hypothetical protein